MPILPGGTNIGPQGTYKWQEVVDVATELVHKIPTAPLQLYACDQVNSIIWKTFPWRWTLAPLTPVTLIDGQQDYQNVPSDFWRWVNPRLIRADLVPPQNQPIKAAKHLEIEVQRKGGLNTIQAVSYEPTNSCFRLDISAQVSGTVVLKLAGDYQQLPPKLTSVGNTIAPPDSYFNVCQEGVLWLFYRLADDPRAGEVTTNRAGERQTSGQMGKFYNALEDMKRSEDTADDMPTRFPENSMGGRSFNGGVSIWPV